MKAFACLVVTLLLISACRPAEEADVSGTVMRTSAAQAPGVFPARGPAVPDSVFGKYWYRGQAELTSYTLEQARYGEMRRGRAVLIYVTEDLSKAKQVKLDDPQRPGADPVKVLKLNFTKKFTTGIYPYSMMSSIFTPVYGGADPYTLKVSTSSQEWCGHTYLQLNLRGDAYRMEQHSYFEGEGDRTMDLDRVLLEDEVWNRIRLDPGSLPTGEVRIIPGTLYQRFAHRPLQVEAARARFDAAGDGERAYTLYYPGLDRTLTIRFKATFPFEILGWEETARSGFGDRARRLTTRATRDRSLMLDYWNHNHNADAAFRAELNLE